MLCQQSDAGEMAPSSLREQADGVGVVLEGVGGFGGCSVTGPETQPSDNTLQQSQSSSRWDTKLHIQKRISTKMIGYRVMIPKNSKNRFEENKVVSKGWVCVTVQAIKTGGGGGLVHKLAGQASRQTTVHLRTEAAPFHHSTVH